MRQALYTHSIPYKSKTSVLTDPSHNKEAPDDPCRDEGVLDRDTPRQNKDISTGMLRWRARQRSRFVRRSDRAKRTPSIVTLKLQRRSAQGPTGQLVAFLISRLPQTMTSRVWRQPKPSVIRPNRHEASCQKSKAV